MILKFESLVFLDIAQDCSLEQCQTSSRAEISKKKFCDPNWGPTNPDQGQYGLFYSNFIKHPVKLAWLSQRKC